LQKAVQPKTVLLGFVTLMVFTSCLKKDNGCNYSPDSLVAPVAEQDSLKVFLDSAKINATKSPDGFYYQIVKGGSSQAPAPCSQITVAYKGWLTNGALFDQSASTILTLGSLIDGWREGLPLIGKGGEIILYLPPSLGYGSASNPPITANSILIFDVSLIDVQ
jgi:FKBP-type peptidyl-prolyl cis-trans isomerase FkpA